MTEYADVREDIRAAALAMFKANGRHFRTDCGSYLFSPKHSDEQMKFSDRMDEKQALLFSVAAKSSKVLEVGTYMGHSLAIMLHANPKLSITTIDLTERYCSGAVEWLQTKFPESQIKFICGNSLDILPTLQTTFDCFHLDGSHRPSVVKEEFKLCTRLFDRTRQETKFVIDDVFYTEEVREYIRTRCRIKRSITSGGYNYNWFGLIDNTLPIDISD